MSVADQMAEQEREQERAAAAWRRETEGARIDGVFGNCAECFIETGKRANVNSSGRLLCWSCYHEERKQVAERKEREAGPLTLDEVRAWKPGDAVTSLRRVKDRILADAADIEEGLRIARALASVSPDASWTEVRNWIGADVAEWIARDRK